MHTRSAGSRRALACRPATRHELHKKDLRASTRFSRGSRVCPRNWAGSAGEGRGCDEFFRRTGELLRGCPGGVAQRTADLISYDEFREAEKFLVVSAAEAAQMTRQIVASAQRQPQSRGKEEASNGCIRRWPTAETCPSFFSNYAAGPPINFEEMDCEM